MASHEKPPAAPGEPSGATAQPPLGLDAGVLLGPEPALPPPSVAPAVPAPAAPPLPPDEPPLPPAPPLPASSLGAPASPAPCAGPVPGFSGLSGGSVATWP